MYDAINNMLEIYGAIEKVSSLPQDGSEAFSYEGIAFQIHADYVTAIFFFFRISLSQIHKILV